MTYFRNRHIAAAFAVMLSVTISSCANVPQEVVDLSYLIGEDLASVHESHKKLIHQHFDNLRAQRIDYLERIWTPAFVSAWIADGHLTNLATGREVYSEEKNDFVKPTPGREQQQLLNSVRLWADEAILEIQKKRSELLSPLDNDEKELTDMINEAFARLFRGNAAITAHLNSLRKVQGVQDDILKALDLKDLREKINTGLARASEKAQTGLADIEAADQKVLKFKSQSKKLMQR